MLIRSRSVLGEPLQFTIRMLRDVSLAVHMCVIIQRRAPEQWQRLERLLLFGDVHRVEGPKLGCRDGGDQYYGDGEAHGYGGRIVMTGESTFTQVKDSCGLLKGVRQCLRQMTFDVIYKRR